METINSGSGKLREDVADKVDDAAFIPGTDYVQMVGAEHDDTTPDSVDEGDAGALRMSANRNLYTTLRDSAGNERGAKITSTNDLQTDLHRSLTPVRVAVSAASMGDNTLVSADATKKIKVLGYQLVIDGTVTATFKSGASTSLSGAMALTGAGASLTAPLIAPGQGHWLETAVNEALVLNLGGAVGVRGFLIYVLEA